MPRLQVRKFAGPHAALTAEISTGCVKAINFSNGERLDYITTYGAGYNLTFVFQTVAGEELEMSEADLNANLDRGYMSVLYQWDR